MSTSIRDEILSMVSSIIPFDSLEKEHIAFVKNWIVSGSEIFRLHKSDYPKIHLVSYFMVMDPKTNEFLLVDHKKAQLWLPPGGHVELNEHPRETVQREMQEELGIEAKFILDDPLFITVSDTVGTVASHTDVSIWYVLSANKDDILKFDRNEFHQIRWFHRDDIPYERTDSHMRRFIEKTVKKLATLNSYDASASQYAKNVVELHPKDEAKKFLQMLRPNAKILDLGCGSGRDAKIFSEMGFEVVGVDFSSKMIEIAKLNAPKAIFNVMDMEQLTFPSDSFEGVWANCALLHLPKKNILMVLNKVHTILKTNGTLYLSMKQNDREASFEADARYGGLEKYWSFFEKDELMTFLISSGFEIIDSHVMDKCTDYHTDPIIKILAKKFVN